MGSDKSLLTFILVKTSDQNLTSQTTTFQTRFICAIMLNWHALLVSFKYLTGKNYNIIKYTYYLGYDTMWSFSEI